MTNATPTTLRGWIQQAQAEGYVWAGKALNSITEASLDFPCTVKDRAIPLVAMYTGLYPGGWRHYHPDRIPKTDVYWVIMQGGEPEKAVLHEGGYAYNPVTGTGFDQSAILFFHEITAPAGPDI